MLEDINRGEHFFAAFVSRSLRPAKFDVREICPNLGVGLSEQIFSWPMKYRLQHIKWIINTLRIALSNTDLASCTKEFSVFARYFCLPKWKRKSPVGHILQMFALQPWAAASTSTVSNAIQLKRAAHERQPEQPGRHVDILAPWSLKTTAQTSVTKYMSAFRGTCSSVLRTNDVCCLVANFILENFVARSNKPLIGKPRFISWFYFPLFDIRVLPTSCEGIARLMQRRLTIVYHKKQKRRNRGLCSGFTSRW